MKELDLGIGNIGSLIKRFSIPCVISMVVAALYNIVDQIFIGWSEAGAYGNAATNIVYPFTVLALLRDVIIFVPASIIISTISKNIVMMLWAAVISDVYAAIIGFIFVRTEIKKCEREFER